MAKSPKPWFVYLARCADGTLYTGISLDVTARIAAHDAGLGARYTRGRGPLTLCAVRRCSSKGEALRLERRRFAAFVRRWLRSPPLRS
jgi:putative endonuclease